MANAKKTNRVLKFLFPASTSAGEAFDELNRDNPLAFFLMFAFLPWVLFAFVLDVCWLIVIACVLGGVAFGANYLLHLV